MTHTFKSLKEAEVRYPTYLKPIQTRAAPSVIPCWSPQIIWFRGKDKKFYTEQLWNKVLAKESSSNALLVTALFVLWSINIYTARTYKLLVTGTRSLSTPLLSLAPVTNKINKIDGFIDTIPTMLVQAHVTAKQVLTVWWTVVKCWQKT